MLKKYLKQEIRTQGKTMLMIYSVLALATILMLIFFLIQKTAVNPFFEGIYYIACGVYALTVTVSAVVSFIYLCYHFYQTMYSQQGYLTHTLPLKTTDILHVKILVSCGFLLLTAALCLLSFAGLGALQDGLSIGELLEAFMQALSELGKEMGVSAAVVLLLIIGMAVAGCVSSLLLFFAGSSVGQLFHRSKGVCGIAAGIGIYYLSEIVSAVVIVAIFYFVYTGMPEVMNFSWFFGGTILLLLFWSAVYYTVCRRILLKHLNLE